MGSGMGYGAGYGSGMGSGSGSSGGSYGGYNPSAFSNSSWYGGQGGTATGFGSSTAGRQSDLRSRRGPKGYQRSDDRLREEVIDKLLQQSDIDLDQIEVQVSQGDVTLSGTVENRRVKHQIEDVIDSVWGVKEITNNLKVSGGLFSGMFGGSNDRNDRSGSRNSSSGSSFSSDDESSRSRTMGGSTSGSSGSSSSSGSSLSSGSTSSGGSSKSR